jgi:hypothetical protein
MTMAQTLTMQELADEAAALDAIIAMDEGDYTEDTEALEQELAAKLATKGDGYGDWLRDRETRAAALKAEEQRLAARRKTLENQVERVKRYAAHALERMGRTKIEGERWTLSLAKNPPRVVLDDSVVPALLPPGFQRLIPAKVEVDMVAVKEALKLGDSLEWARLETTYSVRVR